MILAEFQGTPYLTQTTTSCRWAALELHRLSENAPPISTHCDTYSFGSVMLQVMPQFTSSVPLKVVSQVLSMKVPYYYLLQDYQVIHHLCHGVLPRRPQQPTIMDEHWEFINSCWHTVPTARPTAQDVHFAVLRFLSMVTRDKDVNI